jgi:alkyl hydroperoxide reductase 1
LLEIKMLTLNSGRWAMVFDNGKVTYAENESNPGQVTVSGAEEVLAKL